MKEPLIIFCSLLAGEFLCHLRSETIQTPVTHTHTHTHTHTQHHTHTLSLSLKQKTTHTHTHTHTRTQTHRKGLCELLTHMHALITDYFKVLRSETHKGREHVCTCVC